MPEQRPRGMGRGLSAILSSSAREGDEGLRRLPVEAIAPNPRQPRRRFDEQALAALADSLSARGVLQPVIVRPVEGGSYELIAGERRWRAARLAGLDTVPALVRAHDDAESLELALVENMAREDLNPVEEARACAALVEDLGMTREEVGRRVGRSRVAVSNLLRLLDLPDDVLELVEAGELTEGHARAVLLTPDHDARRELARAAASEGWSVRRLEERARAAAAPAPAAAPATAPPRHGAHPDQLAAAEEIADALAAALGRDVHVRPRGDGYRAELAFESPADAHALAERLRAARPG